MALRDLSPTEVAKLSPEEQTAWFSEQVEDWPQFLDDLLAMDDELQAFLTAGGKGAPPGWTSLRDFLREHPL